MTQRSTENHVDLAPAMSRCALLMNAISTRGCWSQAHHLRAGRWMRLIGTILD